MAKLGPDMPFPEIDYGARDYKAEMAKEDDALDAIRKAHDTISFGVADGCAMYVIASYSPPVLRWVPFGDRYRIPYAHIRGLRAQDLRS